MSSVGSTTAWAEMDKGVLLERNTFLHFDLRSEAETVATQSDRRRRARSLSPERGPRKSTVVPYLCPDRKDEIREVLSAPSNLNQRSKSVLSMAAAGSLSLPICDDDDDLFSDFGADCDGECFDTPVGRFETPLRGYGRQFEGAEPTLTEPELEPEGWSRSSTPEAPGSPQCWCSSPPMAPCAPPSWSLPMQQMQMPPTPSMAPNMSPNMGPNMSPNMAPQMSPNMAPQMSPNMAPTHMPMPPPMQPGQMQPGQMPGNMVMISVPVPGYGMANACVSMDASGRVLGVDAHGQLGYAYPAADMHVGSGLGSSSSELDSDLASEPESVAPVPEAKVAPKVAPQTRLLAEHIYDTMVAKRMDGAAHLIVDVYMEVWQDLCGEQPTYSSRAAVERFQGFLEACPDLFHCFCASVGVNVPNGKGELMVCLVPAARPAQGQR